MTRGGSSRLSFGQQRVSLDKMSSASDEKEMESKWQTPSAAAHSDLELSTPGASLSHPAESSSSLHTSPAASLQLAPARSTSIGHGGRRSTHASSAEWAGHGLRKSKSSVSLLNVIKRSRSKHRTDEGKAASLSSDVPPVPSRRSADFVAPSDSRTSRAPPPWKQKAKALLYRAPRVRPWDLNIKHMDGVVDPSVLSDVSDLQVYMRPAPRADIQADVSVLSVAYPGTVTYYPLFSWSGPPQPTRSTRRRSISYATPAAKVPHRLNEFTNVSQSTLWDPPDSWAVDGKEGSPVDHDYSSSEETCAPLSKPVRSDSAPTAFPKTAYRREVPKYSTDVYPLGVDSFVMRIYRSDASYALVDIPFSATVADLTPTFNKRLVKIGDNAPHKLYLIECGRERLVAQTERPATILWMRLQLIGFEPFDPVSRVTHHDISCTATFTWKSVVLGQLAQEPAFDSYRTVNVSHRRLRAIPTALYRHAEDIRELSLSSNPMLNIPVDFAQACTHLRELSLSHMFLKRIPHGVLHFPQLESLDLSCNRIGDLEEAGLEELPSLRRLDLTNHRLERLPQAWAKMRALAVLKLSNGNFARFPDVVCELHGLVELDLSYNDIVALPDAVGQLRKLRRLLLVANRLSRFPESVARMVALHTLDCKHNRLVDMAPVVHLESLALVCLAHNALDTVHVPAGICLSQVDAAHNPIARIVVHHRTLSRAPLSLTSLDLSHAKLTSIDGLSLRHLATLERLQLADNALQALPEDICDLQQLNFLAFCNNRVTALPRALGRMTRLATLNARGNQLTEIPAAIWNCGSLSTLNLTGNQIHTWRPPPCVPDARPDLRKASVATLGNSWTSRSAVPLVNSLRVLYLGQNRLTDEVFVLVSVLRNLQLLNLSFNDILDIPGYLFRDLGHLQELYLSGNKLSAFSGEYIYRLTSLRILFLNANYLHILPAELTKLRSLIMLDVGSNKLRYNINNWEFDWNWNFNTQLRYLNLSGNKQLEIKPDPVNASLAQFSALPLRVLGLMDVTATFVHNIPEDGAALRVRTTASVVNGLAYGIADFPGLQAHACMLDVVVPRFRRDGAEALFALFGRTHARAGDILVARYLSDHFAAELETQLAECPDDPATALRRAFLMLSKGCFDHLKALRSQGARDPLAYAPAADARAAEGVDVMQIGAAGVAVYVRGRTLYVANAGHALAVVSRAGAAQVLSTRHDAYARAEFPRIRATDGWVSADGRVGGALRVARTFGFYALTPVVTPCPDVHAYALGDADEFVVIANAGLWDRVSAQQAVDIAAPAARDPMVAAQKLRDFAMSYGGDAAVMVMVVALSAPAPPPGASEGDGAMRSREASVVSCAPSRGVAAPVGHVALVFTDICNSTHLWETNAGMGAAIRLHHALLRRQLGACGGYEVKTEGDAFMVAFATAAEALRWCLAVQLALLELPWPDALLACADGAPIYDAQGRLTARGLAVRMGLHCGTPVCGPDAVTKRMDYFGPVVNRAARICACAAAREVLLSADALAEVQARERQPDAAIAAIRALDPVVARVGETKLRNLDVPELLVSVSPRQLVGERAPEPDMTVVIHESSGGGGACDPAQLRALALLCVRVEALAADRVYRPASPDDNDSDEGYASDHFVRGAPAVLLPALPAAPSAAEACAIAEFLLVRLENALAALEQRARGAQAARLVDALLARHGRGVEPEVMQQVLRLLRG